MRFALIGASPAAGAVLHYSASKTICSCDSMFITFAVGAVLGRFCTMRLGDKTLLMVACPFGFFKVTSRAAPPVSRGAFATQSTTSPRSLVTVIAMTGKPFCPTAPTAIFIFAWSAPSPNGSTRKLARRAGKHLNGRAARCIASVSKIDPKCSRYSNELSIATKNHNNVFKRRIFPPLLRVVLEITYRVF
jgi:hypothetical protein